MDHKIELEVDRKLELVVHMFGLEQGLGMNILMMDRLRKMELVPVMVASSLMKVL